MKTRLQLATWFAVPFLAVLALLSGVNAWLGTRNSDRPVLLQMASPDVSALVGLTIPVDDLIEAQSRDPIDAQGIVVPDSAVAILLGGAGCSPNQVKLLRYWAEHHAETGLN